LRSRSCRAASTTARESTTSLQCRAKNTGPRPRTAAADLPMCPGQA
jgi:hypothetical protein